MNTLINLMIASLLLSLAGCVTTSGNGAGYQLLKPSPATAKTIVKIDPVFAKGVIAHNRKCRQDKACGK